ncbi:MAG TPA: hypothetical protein VJN00_12105 [Steroidobacteraceae bacterium]|jgi:hypothetical protein|nr:hypothetical protein [Steroidobacteraceae bacterium]
MSKAFAVPVVMSTLLPAALSGCGATGELYPEILAKTGPLPEGTGRIVLLRSDDFANRNVASPVYVRIDEDLVGKLAYRGFLIAQVPAGEVVLKASARNRMYGVCELPVSVTAGETRYVDVDPRQENQVADIVGTVVSGAVLASTPNTVGVGDLAESVVVESAAAGAAGAAASAATAAVEGAGKRCAGPYRMVPLAEAAALSELPRLKSSH